MAVLLSTRFCDVVLLAVRCKEVRTSFHLWFNYPLNVLRPFVRLLILESIFLVTFKSKKASYKEMLCGNMCVHGNSSCSSGVVRRYECWPIFALKRFVARRGKHIQIVSDNAPQFRLSKGIVEYTWPKYSEDPEVSTYLCIEGIESKFIGPKAP